MDTNITANERYRRSGTTLSFKEWIEREKIKMASMDGVSQEVIINKPLNDAINDSLAIASKDAGNKNRVSSNKVLGVNKYLLIGGAVIVIGSIILYSMTGTKNKKP